MDTLVIYYLILYLTRVATGEYDLTDLTYTLAKSKSSLKEKVVSRT